jgi:hypothetical protein
VKTLGGSILVADLQTGREQEFMMQRDIYLATRTVHADDLSALSAWGKVLLKFFIVDEQVIPTEFPAGRGWNLVRNCELHSRYT